ncbi:hypothetical protein KP509_13G043900 [Ceratopteris richardii]|nr:hypothetical protein KP509_13G043900 [Ceratopteris richardii]
MAASVTIGMSSIAFYDITMAVEQDVNSTTVELSTTSNGIGAQGENSSPTYITTNYSADPSISSQPPSNLSFSIAIPIPHEREWIIIRNGYVAPVPLLQKHVSSGLQCPQWTPSKLEMVLPDFNGRPKAFPRKGYHWFASFVLTGTRDGDFLRLADSRDEIEHIASVHDNTLNSVREELGQQKGMSSSFKKPRVEKLTCFSM